MCPPGLARETLLVAVVRPAVMTRAALRPVSWTAVLAVVLAGAGDDAAAAAGVEEKEPEMEFV